MISSQKIQVIEFLAIFFCDFSAVASPVGGGYTFDFRSTLATLQVFLFNRITIASKKSLM